MNFLTLMEPDLMKRHLSFFKLLTATCLVLAPAARAALLPGDVIVIDIGRDASQTTGTEDPDGTWNNFAPSNQQGFDGVSSEATGGRTITSDLLRYSDGAGTGVGFDVTTIKSGTGAFHGIGNITSTLGTLGFSSTGIIPDSAQGDVGYINEGKVIFTLTGLDDSLTYRLEFLSRFDTARDPNPWVVNEGLASEQTVSVDPNVSPFVYSFSNLATDGSGNITLAVTTPDAGGASTAHLNALELTAIPEPSSVVLSLLGFGLAALACQKRARNG
jgi:hypothetical protein